MPDQAVCQGEKAVWLRISTAIAISYLVPGNASVGLFRPETAHSVLVKDLQTICRARIETLSSRESRAAPGLSFEGSSRPSRLGGGQGRRACEDVDLLGRGVAESGRPRRSACGWPLGTAI